MIVVATDVLVSVVISVFIAVVAVDVLASVVLVVEVVVVAIMNYSISGLFYGNF